MAPTRTAYPGSKESSSVKKARLKLTEVWAICTRLQLAERDRELALFNLGIDSGYMPATSCDFE